MCWIIYYAVWCFTAVGSPVCNGFVYVCFMCLLWSLGTNKGRVDMAHCTSYKLPIQMSPSLRSRGAENSSTIMILAHARRLLRAVLSTGSQHFSSHSLRHIKSRERGGHGCVKCGHCEPLLCVFYFFYRKSVSLSKISLPLLSFDNIHVP